MQYPDMKLYEEIIFLKHFFKGIYIIENVIPYYNALIKPQILNNHCFWSNKQLGNFKKDSRMIRDNNLKGKEARNGFNLSKFDISNTIKEQLLENCVKPEIGLHIFNMCFKQKQMLICDIK